MNMHTDGLLLSLRIERDFEPVRLPDERHAPARKLGNMNKDVLTSPIRRDEAEATILMPGGELACETHQ